MNVQLVVGNQERERETRGEEAEHTEGQARSVLAALGEGQRLGLVFARTVSAVFSMCRLRRATCIAETGARVARSEAREAVRKTDMVVDNQ